MGMLLASCQCIHGSMSIDPSWGTLGCLGGPLDFSENWTPNVRFIVKHISTYLFWTHLPVPYFPWHGMLFGALLSLCRCSGWCEFHELPQQRCSVLVLVKCPWLPQGHFWQQNNVPGTLTCIRLGGFSWLPQVCFVFAKLTRASRANCKLDKNWLPWIMGHKTNSNFQYVPKGSPA